MGNRGGYDAGGGGPRIICTKCKEAGHVSRECKNAVHCVVCGKESHLTEGCTWLRQIKPVAKYCGYTTKGLGCLLVQNTKEVVISEDVNPLAQVQVWGDLNETQFIQDFNKIFN